MNETELFEAELRKLEPATPPEGLVTRLAEAVPAGHNVRATRPKTPLFQWLRWALPASAATALVIFLAAPKSNPSADKSHAPGVPNSPDRTLKADNLELGEQLVATFDAVAHLPSGEPVRFRCSEWLDDVVLRDSALGILIQHRTPRLEVVPVSFETY